MHVNLDYHVSILQLDEHNMMSGILLDARYISIPTIEAYPQSSLNSAQSMSAPTGVVVAEVAHLLQSSIRPSLITLAINHVCVKRKELFFSFLILIPRKYRTSPSSIS
jgi:hypothetical protein